MLWEMNENNAEKLFVTKRKYCPWCLNRAEFNAWASGLPKIVWSSSHL